MNKWFVGCVILAVLTGCQESTAQLDVQKQDTEFIEPEPSDWAVYMKSTREYMY